MGDAPLRPPHWGAGSAPPQADSVRAGPPHGRLPRMFEPLLPLTTDTDLLATANELVGRANQRQTWLFVLDDDQRVSQAILPIIDGIPVDADPRDIAQLATTITEVVRAVGAASVVVVWERPGTADVRMQEADWIAGLAATDAPIRAQLLCSDEGVHLVDPAFAPVVAV